MIDGSKKGCRKGSLSRSERYVTGRLFSFPRVMHH